MLYPVTPTLSVEAFHDRSTWPGVAPLAVRLVGVVGAVRLLFRIAQRGFRPFPLGNVFDHDKKIARVAIFIADKARGSGGPKRLPVLPAISLLDRAGRGACQHRFDQLLSCRQIVGMSQIVRGPVQQFFGARFAGIFPDSVQFELHDA